MSKLVPLWREMPLVLLIYGIVLTVFDVANLQATLAATGMMGDSEWSVRMLRYSSVAGAFYNLFWFAGMAALVSGVNRIVDHATRKDVA